MRKGFTLAELLIALAILGVIATFTIPKVLQSQQDSKFKSIAKETGSAVSDAFQRARLDNKISTSANFGTLTPYLNYLKTDTTGVVDDVYGGSLNCSSFQCLKLHNGGTLVYFNVAFTGTTTKDAVYFMVDPDGQDTSGGRSVQFWLYYNGALRTLSSVEPSSCIAGVCTYNADPSGGDPPWFKWD